MDNWKKNKWRNANKKPVANKNLWEEYIDVSREHKVKAVHVKGHSGDEYNEKCNAKAIEEAKNLQKGEN